jgi:hypothetical protein
MAPARMHIWPSCPETLSVEFLSTLLERPVRAFSCRRTELQGACSILSQVDVDFEAAASWPSARLFIKFPLPEGVQNEAYASNRSVLLAAQAYRKEIAFYRFLQAAQPALAKTAVPPVLFAEIDTSPEGRDSFLLVMREAGRSAALVAAESPEKTPDIVEATMRQLALLGAVFFGNDKWASETDIPVRIPAGHANIAFSVKGADESIAEDPRKLLAYCIEGIETAMHDFAAVLRLSNASEALVSLFARVNDQVSSKQLAKTLSASFETSFFAPQFRTLVHGDLRLENLLECSESNPDLGTRIIDFQGLLFGHPAYDLSQLLIQTLPAPKAQAELHDRYRHLLSIYYNTLRQALGPQDALKVGSLEDLIKAVELAAVFQIVQFAFHMAALRSSVEANEQVAASLVPFHPLIERVFVCYLLLHQA